MGAVFQELEIQWKGKTHRVKPTMALLNRIEQDVSLARLAIRMMRGDTPTSHVAVAVGHMLRAAGEHVSDEEVYQELVTAKDPEAVGQICAAVIAAAFPVPPGNAEPQSKSRTRGSKAST